MRLFIILSGAALMSAGIAGVPAGLPIGSAPAEAADLICASNGYRQNYCPISTKGGVQLRRQLSRAPCIQGRSWGADRRGIWVSNGCAANFTTYDNTGAIVGAALIGGVVGALLGSADKSSPAYDYRPRPYDLPDEDPRVTRQRARDIAAQAADARQRRAYQANQQNQRDIQAAQDRDNDRNQAEAFREAQQHQQDIQDAQSDERQRNEYQANQDNQAEIQAAQDRERGEQDELEQAREGGDTAVPSEETPQ